MSSKCELTVKILLILLIVTTLSFIFCQSALPKEESTEVSEGVKDAIEPIIPSDTAVGSYVHVNIRKIAHFVEFSLLGIEVALYVSLFLAKKHFYVYSFFPGVAVALLDETVQIFSERGSSVVDVWLDISGYSALLLAVYAIFFTVKYVKRRNNKASAKVMKNG